MTPEVTVMSSRYKYLAHGFEIWLAVAAIVAAITHFSGASSLNSVAVTITTRNDEVVDLWHLLYGAGGGLVLAGLYRGSPRTEGAGLCLLASGVLVSALAISFVFRGQGLVTALMQAGAALACIARIWVLDKTWGRA